MLEPEVGDEVGRRRPRQAQSVRALPVRRPAQPRPKYVEGRDYPFAGSAQW
ncbi:MAG: hypothetical protein QOG10_1391 [Kribbellaceae bacterium]|nr:hypothetical protein [Kribbellaceae bacterium]